jgi:hypothetical protein
MNSLKRINVILEEVEATYLFLSWGVFVRSKV